MVMMLMNEVQGTITALSQQPLPLCGRPLLLVSMPNLFQVGLLPRLPEVRVAEQARAAAVAPPPGVPAAATRLRVRRRRPPAEHQDGPHSAEGGRGEGVRGAHRQEGDHPRRRPQLVQRLRRQPRLRGPGTAACPRSQGGFSEGHRSVSNGTRGSILHSFWQPT